MTEYDLIQLETYAKTVFEQVNDSKIIQSGSRVKYGDLNSVDVFGASEDFRLTRIAGYFVEFRPKIVLELIETIKKQREAIEFAHMTLNHALELGYCGNGSTQGMCKDALLKMEKVHPELDIC